MTALLHSGKSKPRQLRREFDRMSSHQPGGWLARAMNDKRRHAVAGPAAHPPNQPRGPIEELAVAAVESQGETGLIWRKLLAPCLARNSLARLFVRSG